MTNTSTAPFGSAEKMCGLGTHYNGLGLIFQNAAGADGEVLVIVEVLAIFKSEYAVTIKRTPSGISIFRTTLRKQLWTQLGPPLQVSRTRQQCLEIVKAAEWDIAPIPMSADPANKLWEAFLRMKLEADSPSATAGKHMLLPKDTTQYIVQPANGRAVLLTEVSRTDLSENPALLNWVHSVLKVAGQWRDSPAVFD